MSAPADTPETGAPPPSAAPADRPSGHGDIAHDGGASRPSLLDLRSQWARMTSDQKLRAKQLGVAASIAVLGYGLYTASTHNETPVAAAPEASRLDMGAGLRGDSLELKLRGDLTKILDGQNLLSDRVTAIEEGKVHPGSTGAPTADGGISADGDAGALPPALPGDNPAYPPAPSGAGSDGASLPPPPAAITLVNGSEDPIAPPAFASAYAARMQAAGKAIETITIPASGHVELISPESAAWKATVARIEAALGRH